MVVREIFNASTLSKVIVGFLLIPITIFLIGEYKERSYKWKSKRRGLALPRIASKQVLGIGRLVRLVKSSIRSQLLQQIEQEVNASNDKTVLSQSLFFGDTMLTIDPENIKSILSTNFWDYNIGLRSKQLSILLGDGIFTQDAAPWKHSREMLKPQFARHQITDFVMFDKHVEELLDLFKSQSAGGSSRLIEMRENFERLTLDFSVEFLLGEGIDSFTDNRMPLEGDPQNPSPYEFLHSLSYTSEHVIRRAQVGPWYFLLDSPELRRHVKLCKDFMDVFVKRALKIQRGEMEPKDSSRYVFINELAKDTQDPIQLRDQCMNILSAGRSTTASLLSMCMFYLTRYPDVWQKLKREIINTFTEDKSGINASNIRTCKYLRAVVNEVIRIRSIVPLNVRQPTEDVVLPKGGGQDGSEPVLVEKGTTILMAIYVMQRSENYWGSDAKQFDPERWMSDQEHHPWAFTPFGGGPRLCLGQQLATNETYYTLIRMAQTFDKVFTSHDEARKEPGFKSGATLVVQGGVWAGFN